MKKEEEQKDMVEMMEHKFDKFEDKVKETIKDELKNHNLIISSFASVVNDRKIVPELWKIIQDEKLKDKEEEKQHAFRKANLMVFGAKDLIKDVGVKAGVKYSIRIGNKKANQVRPIKIVTINKI